MWGTNPSVLKDKLRIRRYLLTWLTPAVAFLVRPRLCLSYWSGCGPSILRCGCAVQLAFRCFTWGIVSCVAIGLLCKWEEVSSGPFNAAILYQSL